MDININGKVTLDISPEFMAVLQGFLKPAGMHAVPAAAPGKVKKADKGAEKSEPAPVAETLETAEETPAAEENTPAATPSVTIEQIRALIPEKKALVGADRLKALLTKYGTQNVTNLPVAHFDAFYSELKNLAA
jgi:hypothetical protein